VGGRAKKKKDSPEGKVQEGRGVSRMKTKSREAIMLNANSSSDYTAQAKLSKADPVKKDAELEGGSL